MPSTTRKSTTKPTKKAASAAKRSAAAKAAAPARKAAAAKKARPAKKTPARKAASKAASQNAAAKKTAATRAGSRPPKATAQAGVPPRRAIFIDVENTSNEAALNKVIDNLEIDRAGQPTEVYAIGNWRAIGMTMSRHLARLGATLVHSAPITGVRDWSDLWIAVAAGRWIATARPGDILEIVSDDKAFEAVGDAAATAGVVFRRVMHRSGSARASAASAASAESSAEGTARKRRRRGGRGRRRGNGGGAAPSARSAEAAPRAHEPRPARTAVAEPRAATPPPRAERPAPERKQQPAEATDHGDAHGASQEQVLATIRRLTGGDPSKLINLDAIANALKSEGFTRPPGSPRLVVRLRRMKDIEVQPTGMVRLVG